MSFWIVWMFLVVGKVDIAPQEDMTAVQPVLIKNGGYYV